MPPVDNVPRAMRGKRVEVRLRVTDLGVVDSVVTSEVRDAAYAARFRTSLLLYRFLPARRDGCAVEGWYQFTLTFPT
jgi:hypothetical protein